MCCDTLRQDCMSPTVAMVSRCLKTVQRADTALSRTTQMLLGDAVSR